MVLVDPELVRWATNHPLTESQRVGLSIWESAFAAYGCSFRCSESAVHADLMLQSVNTKLSSVFTNLKENGQYPSAAALFFPDKLRERFPDLEHSTRYKVPGMMELQRFVEKADVLKKKNVDEPTVRLSRLANVDVDKFKSHVGQMVGYVKSKAQ